MFLHCWSLADGALWEQSKQYWNPLVGRTGNRLDRAMNLFQRSRDHWFQQDPSGFLVLSWLPSGWSHPFLVHELGNYPHPQRIIGEGINVGVHHSWPRHHRSHSMCRCLCWDHTRSLVYLHGSLTAIGHAMMLRCNGGALWSKDLHVQATTTWKSRTMSIGPSPNPRRRRPRWRHGLAFRSDERCWTSWQDAPWGQAVNKQIHSSKSFWNGFA